jgi:hypothetical protein
MKSGRVLYLVEYKSDLKPFVNKEFGKIFLQRDRRSLMAKVSKRTRQGKKSQVLGNPQIINRQNMQEMDLDRTGVHSRMEPGCALKPV